MLLAPVVPKIDSINIVIESMGELGDIIISDGRKKSMNKLRLIQKIHHESLHPTEGPSPFKKGEADRIDPVTVSVSGDPVGDITKKTRIFGIGHIQFIKIRLFERLSGDHPNIVIDTAIPDDTKMVTVMIVTQGFKKTDLIAKDQKMVAQSVFNIPPSKMFFQGDSGFLCKTK